MNDKQLQRVQAYTSITASIAVPLLIAFFGWMIQSKASEDSVRKDYVQMAISILSNKETKEDKELRQWAANVIQESSPVPFGKSLKARLSEGTITILPPVSKEILASPLMAPPKQWIDLPKKNATNRDLLINYLENQGVFQENAITLKYLQLYVRALTGTDNDNSEPANRSSDSKPNGSN